MTAALNTLTDHQARIADLQTQIQNKEDRLEGIEQEQERIRKNMAELSHDSDLYQQYVDKFAEQENEFEALRADISDLKEKLQTAQKQLRDYINGLNIE